MIICQTNNNHGCRGFPSAVSNVTSTLIGCHLQNVYIDVSNHIFQKFVHSVLSGVSQVIRAWLVHNELTTYPVRVSHRRKIFSKGGSIRGPPKFNQNENNFDEDFGKNGKITKMFETVWFCHYQKI